MPSPATCDFGRIVVRNEEVGGSIPPGSTTVQPRAKIGSFRPSGALPPDEFQGHSSCNSSSRRGSAGLRPARRANCRKLGPPSVGGSVSRPRERRPRSVVVQRS